MFIWICLFSVTHQNYGKKNDQSVGWLYSFIYVSELFVFWLIERNEEEIEAVLAKNSKDIEDQICYKLSKACLNVKRSEKLEKPVDADVVINGDTKKAEFKYDVDSMTGSVKEVKGHVKEEPKTLSKKDKKSKKVKKDKTKKKKVENKKDPVDFFQLDLNDPDSMNKVMAQIQEATKEHTKEFYRKKEEEETIKEEEEERKQTEGKDEL